MKKLVCLLMALVMATAVLGGCGTPTAENGQGQSESGKEKVTVALWGTQLLENYAQYLCDEFPEVFPEGRGSDQGSAVRSVRYGVGLYLLRYVSG